MRSWIARCPSLIAALVGSLLALALWLTPASAQAPGNPLLDTLFAQLRVAPDAATARAIDQQIWMEWMSPDDPQLTARMQAIMLKRGTNDLPGAVADLKALVVDYPSYAEGWNQLATLHFLLNDFPASLADIDKVLQFEPRHFGALVGRAMIYRSQGKQALAVKDMASALALHPFLVERAMFPELLDDVTHI